jgi:hypothetical protein
VRGGKIALSPYKSFIGKYFWFGGRKKKNLTKYAIGRAGGQKILVRGGKIALSPYKSFIGKYFSDKIKLHANLAYDRSCRVYEGSRLKNRKAKNSVKSKK